MYAVCMCHNDINNNTSIMKYIGKVYYYGIYNIYEHPCGLLWLQFDVVCSTLMRTSLYIIKIYRSGAVAIHSAFADSFNLFLPAALTSFRATNMCDKLRIKTKCIKPTFYYAYLLSHK